MPISIRSSSGLPPGGLIATTDAIENYPGFPDAINGFDLAERLEHQAVRFETTDNGGLVERVVLGADPRLGAVVTPQVLNLDSGERCTADTVSLPPARRRASWVSPVRIAWPIAVSRTAQSAMASFSGTSGSWLSAVATARWKRTSS